MCLALPAQIVELKEHKKAIVSLGGVLKEISVSLLETVSVGDYVIIHVGFALTKLDEKEAQKTLDLFAQIFEGT